MAFISGPDKLCIDLCDALGLKNVRDIKIHVPLDGPVSVECEYLTEDYEFAKVVKVFQENAGSFVTKAGTVDVTTIGDETRKYEKLL